MEIPILTGIYTSDRADYQTQYPINMQPVILNTGVSGGYLRPVEGVVKKQDAPGISRGAINWNNVHYRVLGSKLCSIDEFFVITEIGDVGDDGFRVSMTYSFDRLAVVSANRLFYWDGTTFSEVTDPNLGDPIDITWVDGYFVLTDGEFIYVTELNDPTVIDPLKYGSSEIDPDPVNGLLKLRNEVYAVNRYTIEVFDNVGGTGFPFQRINGAQIQKGSLGTYCSTVFDETVAFLGSGRNEAPAIYLAANGRTTKISTREIDEVLNSFTEEVLQYAVLEVVNDKGHSFLWVRLPDRTIVYDKEATKALGQNVWFIMTSSQEASSQGGYLPYRAIDVIWVYDNWQIGDATAPAIGVLDDSVATHMGEIVSWEFGTNIIYNSSKGVIFNKLELVALTGRVEGFESPTITTSYSIDGRTWSTEKSRTIDIGAEGDTLKRLVWFRQGFMRNTRIQRFRGDSQAYLAISRLEADLEALGV